MSPTTTYTIHDPVTGHGARTPNPDAAEAFSKDGYRVTAVTQA